MSKSRIELGPSTIGRDLEQDFLHDHNIHASAGHAPAVANDGVEASEQEGRFSFARSPQSGSPQQSPVSTSVQMVDALFRACSLSGFGSGWRRFVFVFWIVWFAARAVYLVVQLSEINAVYRNIVCGPVQTVFSGLNARVLQAGIIMFNFFSWTAIFFCGIGGSLNYFPRLCNHLDDAGLHSRTERMFVMCVPSAFFIAYSLFVLVGAQGACPNTVRCCFICPFFAPFVPLHRCEPDVCVSQIAGFGSTHCSQNEVEAILTDGVFNPACAGDELRIAWAFQRRSALGNSLASQPYDTLFDVFISFISILTPLRFLTLCNCAWRAVKGITDTHFSAHCSSLDVEAFFADLRLANMTSIRIQRLRPLPVTACCIALHILL